MSKNIMLIVPAHLASVVRTALEARAKEFEASLWSTTNNETIMMWRKNAAGLRALAAKLLRHG